ncbi:unnamed protein product [Paramecium octaurelia]|uniref:Uncharacterized protein n=1 Tax=Paramecium octaurelia TaxID=43137 RepID=A0A8S1WQN4_PAROT|nr:unnamed protein product [Paramecium octaurelia]
MNQFRKSAMQLLVGQKEKLGRVVQKQNQPFLGFLFCKTHKEFQIPSNEEGSVQLLQSNILCLSTLQEIEGIQPCIRIFKEVNYQNFE